LLGSVGEPINPELGCGTASTSAETAARSSILGGRPKPGAINADHAARRALDEARRHGAPFSASCPEVVSKRAEVAAGEGGLLVLKKPWPSMLRTIYGDDERFKAKRIGARSPACIHW